METSSRFSFGNPPDLSVRSSQKKEGKIVKMRHLPYTFDQSGYPYKITVKFEDGVEKVYSR